jgi:hypothetical protein
LLGQRNRVLDAAYWIHLRQEIYYALVEQCSIRASLDVRPFDSPADPRNDTDWCNRVVWICVQTLQWAFGGNSTADRWRELQHLVKEWEAHRPRTFEAILDLPGYPSPSDWNAELWYSHNEHGLPLFNCISVSVLKVLRAVDAMEYLLITKLILTIHDPTIPKMGFRVQSAAVNVQVNILFYSIGCTEYTDMPLKGNDPRIHSESVYNSEVYEIHSSKVPRMQCPICL